MDECYIINRMYAGDYLDGSNIGHEIINLFADDKGNNYIYVNPDGLINPIYNHKVKGVLLVRKSGSIHKLEILGIAEVDEKSQISFKSKKSKREDRLAEQNAIMDEYLASHDISYGGVSQKELFAKNKYKGKRENYYAVTFKVNELLLPYQDEDKKVYIADTKCQETTKYSLPTITFSNQSLKQYISREKSPVAFNEITKLINDKDLWDENRKSEKLKNVREEVKADNTFNYLDIIGKQDDENVFSNLITYFLANDRRLLQDFCQEVLGIDGISGDATIEREKSADGPRIDIFIEDEQYAIVIENKIKSEVNSIDQRHDFTGERIKSQLEDYYNYIEKYAAGRDRKYFILMPNYHHIDLQKYKHSEEYQKINYDKVLKFFSKHKFHNIAESGYYNDFKKALSRHAEDHYDDQYAVMKRRFLRRIMECRNEHLS